VIQMGSNEIEMNKMEGTGLFAGQGISRVKLVVLKKRRNGLGMRMIRQEWVLILLNMDMINIKRQQTQFKVALKIFWFLEIWRGVCYQWRISKYPTIKM
jgi:hypothetical protein